MDYKINAPTDGDEMIFRHADIWKNIGSHSDDNESDDTAKEKEDD